MIKERSNNIYGSTGNSNEPEDIDLISNLPDGVIGHILSCLSTKDAVRTSVLSRDWEYKWTNIYKITVEFREKDNPAAASFMSFVDRVLLLTGRSRIMEFSLKYIQKDFPYSDQWIEELISVRNVQYLNIYAPHSQRIIELAPKCFYNSSSLIKLDISIPCVLKVPFPKNSFSNLKSLCLHGGSADQFVELRNEQFPSTDRISLTFPVLEALVLHCKWTNAKYVEICAPELIHYSEAYHNGDGLNDLDNIKICASKLTLFLIGGPCIPNYVLNGHPSRLAFMNVEDIQDHGVYASQAQRILKRFPNLKCLVLSAPVITVLVQSSRSGLGFPASGLHQLKKICLEFCGHWPVNKYVLELLQLLPSVKILSILSSSISVIPQQEQLHVGESYTLRYLQEVNFFRFRGSEYEVGLAGLILKNAINTKQMNVEVKDLVRATTIRQQLSELIPTNSSCVLDVIPVLKNDYYS